MYQSRKAEGLSSARSEEMSREHVANYFRLLMTTMREEELFNKPENIWNMDKTGLQLNNVASKVLATKGSKPVWSITSSEKGEIITVIACCNAEGNILPSVCIMKGKNKKK